MKRLDQITGAILLASGLYILYESTKMPFMDRGNSPGSGWLPTLIALAVVALSILLAVTATLRPASADTPVSWPRGRGLVNNVAIIAGMALSIMVLNLAGYAASTFVFLLVLLIFLSRYDWKVCTGIALVSTTVLYWVFKIWLVIPLPSGILEFL